MGFPNKTHLQKTQWVLWVGFLIASPDFNPHDLEQMMLKTNYKQLARYGFIHFVYSNQFRKMFFTWRLAISSFV